MNVGHLVAVGILSVSGYGCGLVGPSCLHQQSRGTTQEVRAQVGAGETIVHRLSYDSRGSQNDLEISWSGQTDTTGPRLTVYATKAGCETGPLPGFNGTGDCRILSSAGASDGGTIASRLIVTHGRGNPEVLGSPPEFKVWIVGDPVRSTVYTLTLTWFHGPDC